MCQEQTSKELWMNEVWQNCANNVFEERILSVLCIFLLCLPACIEMSPLNYHLFHDSGMFLQSSLGSVSLCSGTVWSLLVSLVSEAAKYNCLERRKQNIEAYPACNSHKPTLSEQHLSMPVNKH